MERAVEMVADHRRSFGTLRLILENAMFPDARTMSIYNENFLQDSVGDSDSTFILRFDWYPEELDADNDPEDAIDPDHEALNRASDRQVHAPMVAAPDYFPDRVFHVEQIRFDERVRNAGLGRLFINVVLQSITRNTHVAQVVSINRCHFPIFFTIDSFYGWVRTRLAPPRTPAGLIFPRYWPADTAEKVETNKEATYAYTNLLWVSPIVMALGRHRKLLIDQYERLGLDKCLQALNDALARVTRDGLIKVVRASYFGPGSIALATNSIDKALANRSALAESITAHCVKLGYSDPLSFSGHVVALQLTTDTFPSWAVLSILTTLVFLIDHCRVFYRPIVMSDELARALVAAMPVDAGAQTINDVLAKNAWDPWHRPHFVRVDAQWLWVPVAKPHSSTYDGKTYIPPPRQETPPFVVPKRALEADEALGEEDDEGEERPTKRARTELPCLHCGTAHKVVAERLAFCTPRCRQVYYD